MLPLTLLRTAQGNPMLVELKNGDTYNGRLVNCDSWMNINLKVRQARVLMQAAAVNLILATILEYNERTITFPLQAIEFNPIFAAFLECATA